MGDNKVQLCSMYSSVNFTLIFYKLRVNGKSADVNVASRNANATLL
jgi:hypothetical protein